MMQGGKAQRMPPPGYGRWRKALRFPPYARLLRSGAAAGRFNMVTRIGIAGITGRMGQLLVEEVRTAGAELVGGIGRPGSTRPAPSGLQTFS